MPERESRGGLLLGTFKRGISKHGTFAWRPGSQYDVSATRGLKKREGVPEMGTKPLKALRGYRASNRGSNRGSRGSNRGSKRSRKTPEALRG